MLGPLEVRTDDGPGEVLEVAGSRLRALLTLLALRPGQLVPASQLIDGLWGDAAPAGAANALQALVSRLRRTLPEAVIESRPAGYQVKLDPGATDIVRFEELAAAGQAQLDRDPAVAAATLRQALALWRGPALVEVAGTSAGRAVAARLDELRLTALENRIDADLRRGVTAGLVAELEGLVVEHPTREPLAARLMRALQAAGRRGAALEVYGQIRERLADELGVDPSAELAALHLELLRDEPAVPTAPWAAAGASQTEASPRTNLRAELTSFVGRDDELAQVAGLLGAYRLVTLTGPGGAGKTRLAVEAARAELDAAGGGPLDGVWLVELAPVSDPGEVPSAVLNALGLREQALIPAARPLASWAAAEEQAADTLGRLVSAVAGRRALLVLDNCEHLVAAAAALADRVLATCPQVRILATSREPLNITGEALWAVGPLTLPPDPAATDSTAERAAWHALRNDPAGLADYASVRLFTQRAQAVFGGFEVTGAGPDPEAEDEPNHQQHDQGPGLLGEVGQHPAGQRCEPGDRQRPQPVEEPLLQVGGQPGGRVQRGEQGVLHHDAWQGEHQVRLRRAPDGTAEDVREQQQEHQRLDAEVDQLGRVVLDLDQRAPGQRERLPQALQWPDPRRQRHRGVHDRHIPDRAFHDCALPGGAHAALPSSTRALSSSSVRRPVSDRNTSSRLEPRRLSSAT